MQPSDDGPGGTHPPRTVPPFDQVGVAVAPGTDLVVRLPGILLVAGAGAPGPPAPGSGPRLGGWEAAGPVPAPVTPAGSAWIGELVALCRQVSAAGRRAPGRRLLDRLRTWLPTVGGRPSFAVVAATEEGLAVALAGEGRAEVPDLGLRLAVVNGARPADGVPFLERLADWPPAGLRLSAGSAVAGPPHPLADLEAGIVPGAAAVLAPGPPQSPAPGVPRTTTVLRLPLPQAPPSRSAGTGPRPPTTGAAADEPAGSDPGAPAPGSGQAPAPVDELPPPALSASLLEPDEAPAREPLPVTTAGRPAAHAEEPDDRPEVEGFACARGHLNDPRVHFCALCGIRMAERTGVYTSGPRPPLGLLVLDDGATVTLDADYLLGREPDTHPRVRTAELRPLLVTDPTGGVSRHHAEVRLEGWDVFLVDVGSANGTLVASPGAGGWSSLVPGRPIRVTPGTSVRVGSRQFTFDSPHGGF
jgi:hypothetical protein